MQDRGLALYRRFLSGDERALEELIALYQRGLLRFIYSYLHDNALSEDVLQEVFIQIYFKRTFKERDNASFKTYLYKIARNKSLNELKKRKRKREVSLDAVQEKNKQPTALSNGQNATNTLDSNSLDEQFFYHEDFEESMEKKQRTLALKLAIDKIKDEYKEVLILRYFDDLEIEDIAKITKKNTKQIYNLLSRGKLALKETLLKEGYDYENF
jgi:RNA polymerase sigma-70 factor (ECF subfamily)